MCLAQAGIAQSVEHFTRNEGVVSSSLISSLYMTDGSPVSLEYEDAGLFLCVWMWSRDARGRWHRSGQGLRRGLLLGLRETAKSIAAGPELACGSDSRPCRNNAVSRSPSSNHPSAAAARPDVTFFWLTLPADRKKTEHGTEADWASCPEMSDWYRIFL